VADAGARSVRAAVTHGLSALRLGVSPHRREAKGQPGSQSAPEREDSGRECTRAAEALTGFSRVTRRSASTRLSAC
jgi:hypothetical protein